MIHIFYQDIIEELKNKITSSVVSQLIVVANEAKANNVDSKELNGRLLRTTVNALEGLKIPIQELVELTGSSPDSLSKELSRRINQDLRHELQHGGELSPRFAGVLGTIGNITYEVIKAITNIIIGPT